MAKTFELIYRTEGIDKLTKSLEKANKVNSKLNKNVKTLNTSVDNLTSDLDKFSSAFGHLEDIGIPGANALNAAFGKMNSLMELGKTHMTKLAASTSAESAGMVGLAGTTAVAGATGTAAFSALAAGTSALWVALAPILPIILAVGLALLVLKKLWDNNVGGMQTHVAKITGMIKNSWGKAMVSINKYVRQLSPLLKPVFAILSFIVKLQFGILIVAFKILGFLIKLILAPSIALSKIMKKNADKQKELFASFMKLEIVQKIVTKIKDAFDAWKQKIKSIIDFIQPLIDAMMKIYEFFGLIEGKQKQSSLGGAGTSFIPQAGRGNTRTTNNNVNTTVMSSGPIKEQDAPRIADLISSSMLRGARSG